MKQLILILVMVVAGYAGYQFFFSDFEQDGMDEETDAAMSGDAADLVPPPPMPGACEGRAKDLENAIYGAASGRVSFAQRNLTHRRLQSCLQHAGFSNTHIDDTIAGIEDRVKRYLKQDGGG